MKTSLRIRISAAVLAAFASSFALAGCLGGDDASQGLPEVVTRILEIDREEGTVYLRDDYYYCYGGESVHDSDLYEEHYVVAGGKLSWTWDEEACIAEVYRGKSTDVIGTWTADPPELDTLRTGLACQEEIAERTLFNNFARNLKVTQKISETEIVRSGSGEPCIAESEAWWMSQEMAGAMTEEVETTASNCNSATMTRVSDDATATITSAISGGRSKVTFKAGAQTCTGSMPLSDSEPENCTDGGAEEVFYDCVASTGFFGEGWGGLEKTAAAAARKHRALRALRASR